MKNVMMIMIIGMCVINIDAPSTYNEKEIKKLQKEQKKLESLEEEARQVKHNYRGYGDTTTSYKLSQEYDITDQYSARSAQYDLKDKGAKLQERIDALRAAQESD